MKGIVFTEFLEMVENRFGYEVVDRIIQAADPESGAAYTSVGTYDHHELLKLVGALSEIAQIEVPMLVREFGKHLLRSFVNSSPQFFEGVNSAFEFLRTVDNRIHIEVRKLYPEAELPTFECRSQGPDHLEMIYRSSRPFADLAEGLMLECVEHFGEEIHIERENLEAGEKQAVRFSFVRKSKMS